MIYLLFGDNFSKSRAKLREIIASQMKKNPDATYFKMTLENWSEPRLRELVSGVGLFQSKFIVVLDGLLSDKNISAEVLGIVDEMADSENIFIFIEEKLSKEALKKIEKKAQKVQEFVSQIKVKSKGGDFNIFTLTDALGARDKKRLWVLYQKAIFSGMVPEEIHRLFFWQIKAMLSAVNSKGVSEAGLNPFVYKKSLGFSKNFSAKELAELSGKLVSLYHDARRGIIDFDLALERFVLGI